MLSHKFYVYYTYHIMHSEPNTLEALSIYSGHPWDPDRYKEP